MQFIEKNSFNVRSAVYQLNRDGTGLEFLIFPMIHVGSRKFYEEISKRLSSCDLILAEGVTSKRASLLTLSYRVVKKIRRMDLVTQQDGMKVESFRDKILNTDMEGPIFDERWSSLPVMLRVQLIILIPVYVVYLFIFGTRETLAENIALEDLPSSEEILNDSFEGLDDLLVAERDQKLIEWLRKFDDEGSEKIKRIGVLYGAFHMRGTMRFLMQKLKYRVSKAEWVTVFEL